MRRFSVGAIVLVCAGLAACDHKTGYQYDREADFSQFKTFAMVDVKGGLDKLSELERRQVTDAVERGLIARGLTKADLETADLYAGIQVGFEKTQEYTTINMGGPWGWGPGWGPPLGWGWGVGAGGVARTTANTVITGTLVVDLYDRAKKQMIWRGQVSKTVDPTRKQAKRLERLDRAVAELFRNYPPASLR